MRVPWKRIVRIAVLVLALVFLVLLVRGQWATLQAYRWQLAPGWALLAFAGLELSWLWELDVWRRILRGLGGPLSYRRACRAWFLSNIVRYIPGNIWQFVGMAELVAEDGVARTTTLTSIVLHQVISTAVGVALAAGYFAAFPAGEPAWLAPVRPLLWAIPLGLFVLRPRWLERVLNWALRKAGRPPICVSLTWAQVWGLLLRYLVAWLSMGLSFAVLVRALVPVPLASALYLTAAWAAAYVIGYLSMLTPSGLGVREGALALLLGTLLPPGVAATIAVVARLWMIAGELLGAGFGLALGREAPHPAQAVEAVTIDDGQMANEAR